MSTNVYLLVFCLEPFLLLAFCTFAFAASCSVSCIISDLLMYLVTHSRQISAFAWMAVSISAAPASPVNTHTFPQSGMERFSASVYSYDHLVLAVQRMVMLVCSRMTWLTLHLSCQHRVADLQHVCHRMLHRRPLTSSEGCAFGNRAHSNRVVVRLSYDRALGAI